MFSGLSGVPAMTMVKNIARGARIEAFILMILVQGAVGSSDEESTNG